MKEAEQVLLAEEPKKRPVDFFSQLRSCIYGLLGFDQRR